MLKYKSYVKILSLILIIVFGGAFLYVYHFSKFYPIPLTHRINMDDKFRFIRDMPNKDKIDTIIVGSSIGLDNIQGVILEESSTKVHHVLNISTYGLKTTQVETHLDIISLFPNVKRVIYSTQFPDFSEALTFQNYDLKFIEQYIDLGKNKIDLPHAFYAYKNIIEFTKNHLFWEEKYRGDKFNFGLAFDRTGSIPLHIYGDMINKEKFFNPHPLDQSEENFQALERISKKMHQKNIKFYLVVEPYRQPLLDKHEDLRNTMNRFIIKTKKIVLDNGGLFLNLHPILKLSDYYFVDRFHLNDQGSALTAKAIAEFNDKSE
jgi:hypothetical protein